MEKYKTEFKLKVVNSFLAGEGEAKLLARHWSVPEEKIRTWVSHYRLHGTEVQKGLWLVDFQHVKAGNVWQLSLHCGNSSCT